MKKTYFNFYILSILLSSFVCAQTQIEITQDDYIGSFTIGTMGTSLGNTEDQIIDIGQPGGNNQWDFGGIPADLFNEINFISPVGTPFVGTFGNADVVAYLFFGVEDEGVISTSEGYSYFSTQDATILGTGSVVNSSFGGQEFTSTSTSIHYPPFKEYNFPIRFGDEWEKSDSSETNAVTSEGAFVTSLTVDYEVSIDAWGTMTMPSGKVVDALRSREVSTTNTYIGDIWTSSGTDIHYFFMGKNGESLSILVSNDEPSFSGSRTGVLAWGHDNVTSVEKLESLPTEFSLKQNYPNPFNPSTKIDYSLTESSGIKLIVYDILGNEVVELVNESQTAGNYRYNFDGSNLSSGSYIVRLSAGERVETIKMILLK